MHAGTISRVALIAGLLLVVWGLVALHRVFREERVQALTALGAEQKALRGRSSSRIRARLGAALAAAESLREEAEAHALVDASGMYLWKGGRQLLPRVFESGPKRAAEVEFGARCTALREGREDLVVVEPGSPGEERRQLLNRFRDAVRAGEAESIQRAFVAFLEHRVHWKIDAVFDLASALAALEYFQQHGDPHPELMRRLLLEGFSDGQGGRLPPMATSVLELRSRLTRAELEDAAARCERLAASHGLDLSALSRRLREEDGRELPFDPAGSRAARALWDAGRWVVEAREGGRWVGAAIDLDALAREVAQSLSEERGLACELRLRPSREGEDVEALEVELLGAHWQEAAAEIESRHTWKSGLLACTALLAVAMAALLAGHQRRRARLLRQQSDFVATVSHELKTPLASMRLMAETLERRLGTEPAARDYPRRMVRAVDGLCFLVDNILSFNRLDQSKVRLEVEELPLDDMIGRVRVQIDECADRRVDLQGPSSRPSSQPGPSEGQGPAEESGHNSGRPTIEADPALLELVLLNLVHNASRYCEHDSARVQFEWSMEPGADILWVRDNGWGFRPADRARAFERFWRAADPAKPAVSGTGLGLAICRMVMDLHGGEIELESSSAEGSVFRLRLPRGRGGRGAST